MQCSIDFSIDWSDWKRRTGTRSAYRHVPLNRVTMCTHALTHSPAGFASPLWFLCQLFSHLSSLLAQLCSPCCPMRFFRLRGRYLSTHSKLLPSSSAAEGVLFPAPNSRVFLNSAEETWRETAEALGVEEPLSGWDFPDEGLLLLAERFWGETLRPDGVCLPLESGVLDLVAFLWNMKRVWYQWQHE